MAKEIELDVREYHERGEDPFAEIMRYVDLLQAGDSLVLINTFEPFPLYRVMEGKGFSHSAEELGPSYLRIRFFREERP